MNEHPRRNSLFYCQGQSAAAVENKDIYFAVLIILVLFFLLIFGVYITEQ